MRCRSGWPYPIKAASASAGATRNGSRRVVGSMSQCGSRCIIATEIATNILRHAGSGCVLVQILDDGVRPELEILGIDRGPGMNDVDQCMRDGYSTAGTAGQGLGAVSRLSTTFDLHSYRNAEPSSFRAPQARPPRRTCLRRPQGCKWVRSVWPWPAKLNAAIVGGWPKAARVSACWSSTGLGHGPWRPRRPMSLCRVSSQHPSMSRRA